MMEKFKVKGSWSTYEYKTRRARTRSEVTHSCQWPQEVARFVKTSDEFGTVENWHKNRMEEIQKWKNTKLKELADKKRAIEQNEKAKTERRLLAQFQVKYNLEPESEWKDVLECIIDKNKYLKLAYHLEMNRNDWSDGSYYAECGLNSFTIESEMDKEIQKDLQWEIDNWDGDGRVFRDCNWNYSRIYNLVQDDVLVYDFEIVKSKCL